MFPEQIVYLSFIVTALGLYSIIRSILSGKTRLNLVTWFFWSLAPIIGVFLQIKAGAGLSVIPVFLMGFGPLVIFIVSLTQKNHYWKLSLFDVLCGIFSFCALVFWIITKNTELSILFALLADLLAAIPTVVKTWKFPETEHAAGYTPGIINNILGLLVITDWRFSIYCFSVYVIILNSILVLLISRKKFFKQKTASIGL